MNCPKCGKEIPEGNLLCESCGWEVRIVPEYESQVEQKIDETMSRITDDIAKQTREAELEIRNAVLTAARKLRRRNLILLGAACGAVFCGFFFFVYIFFWQRTESFYVGNAYKMAQNRQYRTAAEEIDKALSVSREDSEISLLLLKDRYLQQAQDPEGVRATTFQIAGKAAAKESEIIKAYGILIEAYAEKGDFQKISEELQGCPEKSVQDAYRDYMTAVPVFESPAGNYEDHLQLPISAEGKGYIVCRITRTEDPDEEQSYSAAVPNQKIGEEFRYETPLELDRGSYSVDAFFVNNYGARGETVSAEYVVTPDVPDAPRVITQSGDYTSGDMIEAEIPDESEGSIHYTTDGSDPDADSPRYTEPIQMPEGKSRFRFAVISPAGVSSEIKEQQYSVTRGSIFPIEEGPNYIIVAMMRAEEVASPDGTIRDGSARYSYRYDFMREIEGRGSFYIYSELLVDLGGNSALTGRRFAVNIYSGTTYHFEEPSYGVYELIPVVNG